MVILPASKTGSVPINTKHLLIGFSTLLEMQNFKGKKKEKKLKIVTHLPWNVNRTLPECVGQAIM